MAPPTSSTQGASTAAKRDDGHGSGQCEGKTLLKRSVASTEVDEGPCNIERVQWADLSVERFDSEYKEQRPVIVVTGLDYNKRLRAAVAREALLEEYGDMIVSLGTAESYTGRSSIQVCTCRH